MDGGTSQCYDIGKATSVTLAWSPPATNTNGTKLTDLSGYRVYHGTTRGVYNPAVELDKDETSCEIDGLSQGVTYYFTVTAYNSVNVESGFSNSVCVTTTD